MKLPVAITCAITLALLIPITSHAEGTPYETEERLAELRAKRAAIDVRSPQGWRIAGGVLGGVGVSLAAGAGLACALASSGSSTTCRRENAGAIAGVGGGLAAIGLVTFLTANSKLSERRQELRAIDRQIMELRQTEASKARDLSIAWGVSLGETNGVTIAIRY